MDVTFLFISEKPTKKQGIKEKVSGLLRDTGECALLIDALSEEKVSEIKMKQDVSLSPLVLELLIKRYGLSTNYEPYMIQEIEREIILEGIRLQKKNDW